MIFRMVLFLYVFAVLTGCALFKPAPYSRITRLETDKESVSISMDKIDGHPTYEIFFMLAEKENDIRLNIEGESTNVVGILETARFFFVVEKRYETGNSSSTYSTFIELGRNLDNSWNSTLSTEIRGGASPLTSLSTGVYRVRFTFFNDNDFNCTVSLFTTQQKGSLAHTIQNLEKTDEEL
jgi:hypothetical protein